MDTKKISFGFSKLTKKTSILAPPVKEKKIDFIECLEGHSIKIKNAVEKIVEPLIIPLNDNSKNLLDRIKQAKKMNKIEPSAEIVDNRPDSELTIEELAARELLREATNTEINSVQNTLTLTTNTDKFVAEGKDESTLDDYENIPISEYGLAMLRGMGWSEDKGIGKNEKKINVLEPELRPKGMGLGASKIIKTPTSVVTDKDGKELSLVKGAYVKIIGGQHKDIYCEVQGLDEESGRVIMKSAKGMILTINEFLLTPVTKDEYVSSKVINNVKYEKYKENSNGTIKKELNANSESLEDEYVCSNRSRSGSREEEIEISKNKQHKSGKHKRNSSPSNSSDKRKEKKKKSKHKRNCNSSDSDYEERSKSKHNKHKSDESKKERLRNSKESSSDDEQYRSKSEKTYYKCNTDVKNHSNELSKHKHSSRHESKRDKNKRKFNKSSSSESEYERSNKYKR